MAVVAKKCANPACACVPQGKEKYCSAHCEGVGDKVEIMCTCGHSPCTSSGMLSPGFEGHGRSDPPSRA